MLRFAKTTFVVALLISHSTVAQIAPVEAVRAASDGMQEYIKLIPRDELVRCGLPHDFSADEIEIGPPLRVFVLDVDDHAASAARSVDQAMRETNMWFFPILCRGQYVSILTVDFHKNAWLAAGLGKAALSRELQVALAEIAHQVQNGHFLARNYDFKADFLVTKIGADYSFYLFRSARIALGRDPARSDQTTCGFEDLIRMIDERKGAKED
jgi:hypothetical protein